MEKCKHTQKSKDNCIIKLSLNFNKEQLMAILLHLYSHPGFPSGSVVKNLACNAGDLGRSPGGGHGSPLQYSFLENPMERGAWWAVVHRVAQSQTRLKWFSRHACMHWRRKWQPTPVFLPGEFQGQRSLVGCCLCGHTELDMTEAT